MKARSLAYACIFVFCAAVSAASVTSARAQSALPNPVLVFQGAEPYTAGGIHLIRYRYFVFNSDAYPATLFSPAPALPPCGNNANASRTWVDLFDSRGKRLFGFCSLTSAQDLNTIWFGLPADQIPPSYIYIELHDRQTNTKYRSNLADTVM